MLYMNTIMWQPTCEACPGVLDAFLAALLWCGYDLCVLAIAPRQGLQLDAVPQ